MGGGFRTRPGAGGAGGTGGDIPRAGATPGAAQEIQDQYWLRLGVRADDAQTGLRSMAESLREASQQGVKQTSALAAGFRSVQKAAGVLGLALAPGAIVRGMLEAQSEVRALRMTMYEAGREATRGGGAVLEWTKFNEEAYRTYNTVVEHARIHWRRSAEDVRSMFIAVSRSGIGMVEAVGESADKVMRAVADVSDATRMAFALEFLGFDPEQITSIYRSLSVNLRQSVGEIETSMYQFLLISQDTTLAWRDQIRIVVEALAQYSKFGVSLDQVTLLLSNLVAESKATSDEFFSVGLAYDVLMEKLNIRAQTTPRQWITAFSLLAEEDIEQVVTGFKTGQLTTLTPQQRESRKRVLDRLTDWLGQLQRAGALPPSIGVPEVLRGAVPRAAWAEIAPGLDPEALIRLQPVLTRRLGEGRQIMGIPAGQSSLFAEALRSVLGPTIVNVGRLRAGRLADPVGVLERIAGQGDAQLTNEETSNRLLEAMGRGGSTANQYFKDTDRAMRKVADNTTGILKDVSYIASTLFRSVSSTEAREQWRTKLDAQRSGERIRYMTRWIERGGGTVFGRGLQVQFPRGVTAPGMEAEREAVTAQLSGTYKEYFQEGFTEEAAMKFIQTNTPLYRTRSAQFLELIKMLSRHPAFRGLITSEAFPDLPQVMQNLLETGVVAPAEVSERTRRWEEVTRFRELETQRPPSEREALRLIQRATLPEGAIGPVLPEAQLRRALEARGREAMMPRPGELPVREAPVPEEDGTTGALPRALRERLGLEEDVVAAAAAMPNIELHVNIAGEEINVPLSAYLGRAHANERPTDVDTAASPV